MVFRSPKVVLVLSILVEEQSLGENLRLVGNNVGCYEGPEPLRGHDEWTCVLVWSPHWKSLVEKGKVHEGELWPQSMWICVLIWSYQGELLVEKGKEHEGDLWPLST